MVIILCLQGQLIFNNFEKEIVEKKLHFYNTYLIDVCDDLVFEIIWDYLLVDYVTIYADNFNSDHYDDENIQCSNVKNDFLEFLKK